MFLMRDESPGSHVITKDRTGTQLIISLL